MTPTPDLAAVYELMLSPTMGRLAEFAQGFPLDVRVRDDLHVALCTMTVDLVRAIDANRIHFDRDEDAAIFHGLLVACLQIVFDGKFAASAEQVRMQ